MKIVVCLKQVPDPRTVVVDPVTGNIDARRLLYIVNPADEGALALALSLAADRDEVHALTVGPESAAEVLREALMAGAGSVLRLWDECWTTTEAFRTATLLRTALRIVGIPDLILCGARSSDRGTGQVPGLLAALLDWPVVTDVARCELGAGRALLRRRLDRGAREAVEVALPAVIGLEPGIARLPHASLPNLMSAHRARIGVLHPSELGLSAADLRFPIAKLEATLPPHPRPRPIFTPDGALSSHERIAQIVSSGVPVKSGQVLTGPSEELASALVDFLRRRGFVFSGARGGIAGAGVATSGNLGSSD